MRESEMVECAKKDTHLNRTWFNISFSHFFLFIYFLLVDFLSPFFWGQGGKKDANLTCHEYLMCFMYDKQKKIINRDCREKRRNPHQICISHSRQRDWPHLVIPSELPFFAGNITLPIKIPLQWFVYLPNGKKIIFVQAAALCAGI